MSDAPPAQRPMSAETAARRWANGLFPILLLALIVVLAVRWDWNADTVTWSQPSRQMAMADTHWIMEGYRRTPSPLAKHLWLTGPWIESLSPAEQGREYREFFRPLASVDLWVQARLGLTRGFLWVSAGTLTLFIGLCALCAALSWRLTRSRACAAGSGALCAGLPFIVSSMPSSWIAWFPVRQDLLALSLMLGALIAYDCWKETGGGPARWAARACVLLAYLTKEYAYVLMLMAPLLLMNNQGRPRREADALRAHRREGLGVAGLALGFLAYRQIVLPHPYRPDYKGWSWATHPLMHLAHPYYLSLNGGVPWLALSALGVFFAVGGALRAASQGRPWGRDPRRRLAAAGAVTALLAADVLGNHAALTEALSAKIWYFADPAKAGEHVHDFLCLVGYAYVYSLVVKYRQEARTVTAFGLMALAYLPVVGLDGFHYWIGGGVLRAVFWPLVAALAWRDIRPLVRRQSPPPTGRIPRPRR